MTSTLFIYSEIIFHCTVIGLFAQASIKFTQSSSALYHSTTREKGRMVCARLESIKRNFKNAQIWIKINSNLSKTKYAAVLFRYHELMKRVIVKEIKIYGKECTQEYGDFIWHYERNPNFGEFFPNWIALLRLTSAGFNR